MTRGNDRSTVGIFLGAIGSLLPWRGEPGFPTHTEDMTLEAVRRLTGRTDLTRVEPVYEHHGTALHLRLRLTGGPDCPETVFVKLAPVKPITRLFNNAMNLAGNEAEIYRRIGPELGDIVPHIFGAASDPGSGRAVIIMEDLAARGAQFGIVADGCSTDQAAAVAEALGTLHSRFQRSPRLERGGDLSFVTTPTPPAQVLGPYTWRTIRTVPDDYTDLVPDGFLAKAAFINTRRREVAALIESSSDTLIHGDTHLGNICFVDNRPVFFDWQVSSKGPGLKDLTYFASLSLNTADRRAVDQDLVRIYLEAFNAGGDRALTFDEAWHNYRLFTFIGFIGAVFTANLGRRLQEVETTRASLARAIAALDDLETLDLLARQLDS